MDADLRSIAAARRTVEAAWSAYLKFQGADPALIDRLSAAASAEAFGFGGTVH